MAGESLTLTAAFQKGGPVMVVLAALSVYSVAAILYKAYQFHTASLLTRTGAPDGAVIAARAAGSDAEDALLRGLPAGHPACEIAAYAAEQAGTSSRYERAAAYGNAVFRRLESHLRGLEIIGAAAPLLGLLGTVAGMADAFSGISSYGTAADPSVLAGGIWEALLTTIAGLIVAIPAMSASYMFNARLDSARQLTQDAVKLVLASGRGELADVS